MLGKEEDITCNLSSPIHIYLIVTQLKKTKTLYIYQESKDQNKIDIDH
jgi:hypothetical protein